MHWRHFLWVHTEMSSYNTCMFCCFWMLLRGISSAQSLKKEQPSGLQYFFWSTSFFLPRARAAFDLYTHDIWIHSLVHWFTNWAIILLILLILKAICTLFPSSQTQQHQCFFFPTHVSVGWLLLFLQYSYFQHKSFFSLLTPLFFPLPAVA